jgi:hypothetical protein
VELLQRDRLESSHKVWKDCVFCIPKKVIPIQKEMVEEQVQQRPFELARGLYRNAHFLVPKNDGKYRFIICAVSANCHTSEDAGIPPNGEEFSEEFAGLPHCSVIDFHHSYNHKVRHKESHNYVAFQTTQGMYRPTGLVQGATNLVSAFV